MAGVRTPNFEHQKRTLYPHHYAPPGAQFLWTSLLYFYIAWQKSLIFIFFGFYLRLFIASNSSTVAVSWKLFHFLAHKNKMYEKGPIQEKHLKVTKSILFLALYYWIVTQMMEDCFVICNTWQVFFWPICPKRFLFPIQKTETSPAGESITIS